jgi:uncharacterized membrane protein YqhA
MDRFLSLTRYIVLIGVVGLLLAAFAGFVVSLTETVELVYHIGSHLTDPALESQEINFIKLVDGFLVSTGLLIFALGLYEIFFSPLNLPKALQFTSIGQLKSSLAGIIALTLGVTFLTIVDTETDAMSILWKGLAIAAVILVLVYFARAGEEH